MIVVRSKKVHLDMLYRLHIMKSFFSSTIREYEFISAMHITYVFTNLSKKCHCQIWQKLLSVKCKFLSATNSCYIIWRLAKLSLILYSNGLYAKIFLQNTLCNIFDLRLQKCYKLFYRKNIFPNIVIYKELLSCCN